MRIILSRMVFLLMASCWLLGTASCKKTGESADRKRIGFLFRIA